MKITFTFGSEEIDCEEYAENNGIATSLDDDEKVTTTYELNDEEISRVDELKKLRMEELCREFFNDKLADETVAVHWQN